jgi:peptidyl-prolyl cis-trans isomerase B (cyclophilin B)
VTTNRWLAVAASTSAVIILTVGWYYHSQKPQGELPGPVAGQQAPRPADDLSRGLLEQMQGANQEHGTGASTPQGALTNQQLEDAYLTVNRIQQQIDGLQAEAAAAGRGGDKAVAAEKLEVVRGELAVLNEKLLALQGDLGRARAARPADPTIQWLSGELLMLVGGEPEEILPYFERAVKGGLRRPDALAGVARVQLEANQFEPAYETALSALTMSPHDPKVWEVFGGVALATGRFGDVLARIDGAYPGAKPDWAARLRLRAGTLQDAWEKEQAIRRVEEAAGNLPRVRLTIEHRAFAKAADGTNLTTPKTTGRDEVEFELFLHEAPITVANFLKLVERGFYNGTRFHWAEAASMVVGGDPNTKNDDPSKDGTGGPGYVIADEFKTPGARLHFRGSVAMVESAAHTAGSQFFIELVPHPEMNHHLTVFGRVARGQDGVDRITSGRTNMRFGRFGKIIPGDLLVRAEVIR